MRITNTDLVEFFDQWPPFLVYAMARKPFKGRLPIGLTMLEIAKASGLSLRSVTRLSAKLSWRDEKLSVIAAFCKGCNFSFYNIWRQREFIKKNVISNGGRFGHLSTARWNTYLLKCIEFEKLNAK